MRRMVIFATFPLIFPLWALATLILEPVFLRAEGSGLREFFAATGASADGWRITFFEGRLHRGWQRA